MASAATLEDRFNAAVETIQNLPANGSLQPSNLTKLIFYGLYKQVTLGPCKEPRPSLFNYVGRAKWEAWDRCRLMTKEQAMLAYIDEIRKLVETLPQTNEVLEFIQLIGLSNKPVDERSRENDSMPLTENVQHETTATENKESRFESFVNDTSEDDYKEHPLIYTNNPTQTLVSARNDTVPSSSPSISSTSSSISSSDIDEFYDDPSDLVVISQDELTTNNNQQQPINTPRLHHIPHVFSGQNGVNIPVSHSTVPSTRSPSFRQHNPSTDYNKETQRAILTALAKLQRDINNILTRLNRLETSAYLLQQKELTMSTKLDSSSRWLPLSGLRRGVIAFILLWPFVAFILIRLLVRARIIIRFRRQRL